MGNGEAAMSGYKYACMSAAEVVAIATAIAECEECPSGYMADDMSLRVYKNLLSQGYRWVRTDGEVAVFEKAVR